MDNSVPLLGKDTVDDRRGASPSSRCGCEIRTGAVADSSGITTLPIALRLTCAQVRWKCTGAMGAGELRAIEDRLEERGTNRM